MALVGLPRYMLKGWRMPRCDKWLGSIYKDAVAFPSPNSAALEDDAPPLTLRITNTDSKTSCPTLIRAMRAVHTTQCQHMHRNSYLPVFQRQP